MRSIVTPQFRKMLSELPERIQEEAREGFARWKEEPQSVGWKKLAGMHSDVYSVEIGRRYRAMCVVSKEHNTAVWVFAGSHETYNNFISIRRSMKIEGWLSKDISERIKERREENAAKELHSSSFISNNSNKKRKVGFNLG